MPKRDELRDKLARLEALRPGGDASPDSGATANALRAALRDRSNHVVAKAARITAACERTDLVPDLLTAYAFLFADDPRVDPVAQGKVAIAKALRALDVRDPEPYLRGIRHIQLEAAWGPPIDAAAPLRSECIFGLTASDAPAITVMRELTDRIGGDDIAAVRADAARALATIPTPESLLLLRLKTQCGDQIKNHKHTR